MHMLQEKNNKMGNRLHSISPYKKIVVAAIFTTIIYVLFPPCAFAASSSNDAVGFAAIVEQLKTLMVLVFIPLGLLVSVWKILYLAIFCGMLGVDPLNELGGNEGDISTDIDVIEEIKKRFQGIAKGFFWVAGVWVIFYIALTIASLLAGYVGAIL